MDQRLSFTFLITSARLKPPGEPDTWELPACVHLCVIYFTSVKCARTSCGILRLMLLLDMCDREAFSLSVVCLAGWIMTTGLTAEPVKSWRTIYHNTHQVHRWLSIWFEAKCTGRDNDPDAQILMQGFWDHYERKRYFIFILAKKTHSLVRVAVFNVATVRTILGDSRSLWWLFKAALFFSDLVFVSPGATYCL